MLIDTSALLRTLQPAHPQREVVRAAIGMLTTRGRGLHLVPQVLVELWVVATRPVEQNGLGMAPHAVAVELARLKNSLKCWPRHRRSQAGRHRWRSGDTSFSQCSRSLLPGSVKLDEEPALTKQFAR